MNNTITISTRGESWKVSWYEIDAAAGAPVERVEYFTSAARALEHIRTLGTAGGYTVAPSADYETLKDHAAIGYLLGTYRIGTGSHTDQFLQARGKKPFCIDRKGRAVYKIGENEWRYLIKERDRLDRETGQFQEPYY